MGATQTSVIRVRARAGWEAEQQALSDTHLPWRLERREPGAATGDLARIRTHELGPVRMVDTVAAPSAGRRGPREISLTEGTWIAAVIYLGGRTLLSGGDARLEARAGSCVVWDSTRPGEFAIVETERKRTLFFPRDLVTGTCPPLNLSSPLHLTVDQPEVRLFRAVTDDVARCAPDLDMAARHSASQALLELLACCLRPQASAGRTDLHAALFTEACALIERRLGDPDLRPADLAGELKVSLRTLQDVFAERGTTIWANVRSKRLARCHAELERAHGRSVTDIAFANGFTNATHFSRSFRRSYGLSPREVRAAATSRGTGGHAGGGSDETNEFLQFPSPGNKRANRAVDRFDS